MFKGRTLMLLAIATLVGCGAAWYANQWINQSQYVGSEDVDQKKVVVSAMAIPYGQKVKMQHVRLITMPVDMVPEGAFFTLEEVENKIANTSILAGDILRKERFTEHMGGSTLAALIEPNKRAISVRVNDVVGVAGFLLPGNNVDVISSRKGANKRIVTNTVLKNIKVLAVDQTSNADENKPVIVRAVTLEMTPKQTEVLIKARDEGKIQLTLRNPMEEVVAEVKKPVVKKTRKRKYRAPSSSVVTVIRGTSTEKTKVKL